MAVRSDISLDLGFTRSEIVGRVRAHVLDGAMAGYAGRQLFAYLDLVNPLLPGSRESRIWHRERRRILGRVKRTREPYIELRTYLQFGQAR
jgi:hypothetical protein